MSSSKKPSSHPPGGSASPAEVNLDTADKAASSPETPSDRDEAPGATGGAPSEKIQQASRDVERGLPDTSRGEATSGTYDKLKK